MYRTVLAGLTALTLVACTQQVPDSGAGVGYSPYSQYEVERARREALLNGSARPLPGGQPIVPTAGSTAGLTSGLIEPTQTTPLGGIPSSDLAAAGIGSGTPIAAGTIGSTFDPNRTTGVQASPSNAVPVQIASTGISDEQSFEAVASERGIEDDAALREQQQAAYQVIQPTALPQRDGNVGPNIVEYALNAPNRKGQEWYSRSLLVIDPQGKFQRNCASYRSPDEAQRDFLSRGGPERDPRGLDPDGDGFACGWDPAPFLIAVGRG